MARIEKNTALRRYEMTVDGHTAIVEYRDEDAGTVRLLHTEVPSALEGRGIGSRLAKERGAGRGPCRGPDGRASMRVHRIVHRAASRVSGSRVAPRELSELRLTEAGHLGTFGSRRGACPERRRGRGIIRISGNTLSELITEDAIHSDAE